MRAATMRSARLARTRITMPRAATSRTMISPRVSRARKSTRITLTTLRPCASGSARARYSSPTGTAVRAAPAMRAKEANITPTPTAMAPRRTPEARTGRRVNLVGRLRRTSAKITRDSVSMSSCVSARSGAPWRTNRMATP